MAQVRDTGRTQESAAPSSGRAFRYFRVTCVLTWFPQFLSLLIMFAQNRLAYEESDED